MKAAASNSAGWQFAIRGEATPELEIDVYDVVGGDMFFGGGVTAQAVRSVLKQNAQASSIKVRMNSAGGDVFEGMAIYSQLMEHTAKVVVQVDGLCASIASIIAMAGDEIVMGEGTWMMIHKPYSALLLDQRSEDLRNTADALDKMTESMAAIYAARTGQSKEDVTAAMQATTWMTADEAKKLGYATSVVPAKTGVSEPDEETQTSAKAMVAALLKDYQRVPAGAFMAMAHAHGARTMNMQANAKTASAKAEEEEKKAKDKASDEESELDKLKKDKAALEAKVAELEAKMAKAEETDDEEEDDEDVDAKAAMAAVVAVASEITGQKDIKQLEGALMAFADRAGPAIDPKAVRAKLVGSLIAEGKLAPARKAWAIGASDAALEGYLAGLGGQRVAPIGVEHQPGHVETQVEPAKAALKLNNEELTVMRGLGLTEEQARAAAQKRTQAS